MDCLFCKIINGEIPSNKVYEDDLVYAFNDISPEAPVHILIVPKKHYDSILDVNDKDLSIIGHINKVATIIAKETGIDKSGFRIINNCGEEGGQTVNHIHYHLLGGRMLKWPPG